LSEVQKRIRECIAEIELYAPFSPDVRSAINELREIENLIANPNRENVGKALRVVAEFYEHAQVYSSYVPTTTSNLKFIKEWLEKSGK